MPDPFQKPHGGQFYLESPLGKETRVISFSRRNPRKDEHIAQGCGYSHTQRGARSSLGRRCIFSWICNPRKCQKGEK